MMTTTVGQYQMCKQCEEVVEVDFFYDDEYCCEECYELAMRIDALDRYLSEKADRIDD